MRVGVVITSGLQNWQILQQQGGCADVNCAGWWLVEGLSAGKQPAISARILREEDNAVVIPWQACEVYGVNWCVTIPNVPMGGLYRFETMIDYEGSNGLTVTRGDMIHHFGIGEIFVIAGQSNAAGRAKDAIFDPPELGVHMMRASGRWDLASHPLGDTTDAKYDGHFETANPAHCPYLAFGKRMRAALNRPIGLMQTALGGSGLWQWDKAEEATLFHNMLRMLRDNAPRPAGILWIQGCADAFELRGADYFERFARFVRDVREALSMPELPFYTVQINRCTLPPAPGQDISWGQVREAQRRAAREIPGVYVVPSIDLPLYDFIHNSAAANLVIAERQANCALAEGYGLKRAWRAPEIARADRTAKDTVRVEFEGILNWINPFEVAPKDLPFTAEDAKGQSSPIAYSIEGASISITFDRPLENAALLHGAWQMCPPPCIPCDCMRMAMLAFYGFPIKEEML